MKECSHIRRISNLRRHAIWLAILGLYGLVLGPLSHVIGHEDDHVHTPDGGIVYKTGDSPSAADGHDERHAHHGHGADHHHHDADHHEHRHSHDNHERATDENSAHAHDHDDTHQHDGPDRRGDGHRNPAPLDHATNSFAHFSASLSAATPYLDVPPATDSVGPVDVEPITVEALPTRAPRLEQASPRGPPELVA